MLAGRFRLESRLGSGTYGAVWRAYDQARARPVALKILHPERRGHGSSLARFQREAEILSRLDHPNIVRAYAWAHDDEAAWLAMELVEGAPLSLVLGARAELQRPLLPHEVAHVVGAVADAVACAHEHGVVHRDLKPRNVLIGPGDAGRVTVLDFGVAKLVDTPRGDATTVGRLLGSLLYMSPEQLRAEEVSAASDVFALATITFELLTLRRPWALDALGVPLPARDVPVARDATNNHATVLGRISRGPRPSTAPWVSGRAAELDAVLHAAWAPTASARTADVPSFVRALASALGVPLGVPETLLLDRAEATPTLRLAEPEGAPTALVSRPASSPTVRLVEPEWVVTQVGAPHEVEARAPSTTASVPVGLAAIAAAVTVRGAQDPASAIGQAVTQPAPKHRATPPGLTLDAGVGARAVAAEGAEASVTVPLAERPPDLHTEVQHLHTEVHERTRVEPPLRARRHGWVWAWAAAAVLSLGAAAGARSWSVRTEPAAPTPPPAPEPAAAVAARPGAPPIGGGAAIVAEAAGAEDPQAPARAASVSPPTSAPGAAAPLTLTSASSRPPAAEPGPGARPRPAAAPAADARGPRTTPPPARAEPPRSAAHAEALARVARLTESSDAVELAEAAQAIAQAAGTSPSAAARSVERRAQALIMTPSLDELRRLAAALSPALGEP